MSFDAFAIPHLDGIPARYVVPTADTFLRPLALSMLNDGLVDASDIARRPPSTMALCTKVLTRHWHAITEPLTLFDWHLRIEEDKFSNAMWAPRREKHPAPTAWAAIKTERGPISCSQVCVGPAVEWLEGLRKGLGQTILAALYDVLRMLPLVCTTETTIAIGQYTYWQGYDNEEDAMAELVQLHDCTREELLDSDHFITQRGLYGPMPTWAANPTRVLSRTQVNRAARGDRFATQVLEAMDELWTVLTFCGPFPDLSTNSAGAELIDFTLIVRWSDDDSTGRVLDDYGHFACEGDYIDAASVTAIALDDQTLDTSLADWLQKMRAAAMLARAAERVLALLGSREFEQQRLLVRVFA